MIKKQTFSKLIKIIAATIDNLEEVDIDKLLSGKAKLIVEDSNISKTNPELMPATDHQEIILKLNVCKDRDEARRILSGIGKKKELTAIAKSQKLHITKQDRREDIENKVIEFFIGAKLRTEAIQTLNMKGGGDNG